MGSLAEERCCFAQGDLHRQVKAFAVSSVHQNGPLASETIIYQKRHNPMLNSAK
jgi:hypothetical protein